MTQRNQALECLRDSFGCRGSMALLWGSLSLMNYILCGGFFQIGGMGMTGLEVRAGIQVKNVKLGVGGATVVGRGWSLNGDGRCCCCQIRPGL